MYRIEFYVVYWVRKSEYILFESGNEPAKGRERFDCYLVSSRHLCVKFSKSIWSSYLY